MSQTKSNLDGERIGANKEVKKERVTKFGSANNFWAICSLFEGKGLNKKERWDLDKNQVLASNFFAWVIDSGANTHNNRLFL